MFFTSVYLITLPAKLKSSQIVVYFLSVFVSGCVLCALNIDSNGHQKKQKRAKNVLK